MPVKAKHPFQNKLNIETVVRYIFSCILHMVLDVLKYDVSEKIVLGQLESTSMRTKMCQLKIVTYCLMRTNLIP